MASNKFSILVTGGAGYIGSILVPMLLAAGHKVTVIDSFRYGQTPLLDVSYLADLKIFRGDVRDKELVKSLMAKADVIIPLACLTGAPVCDRFPQEAEMVNLEAVKFIIKFKSRRQRIIFPNTNSGYGAGRKIIYCTEETPLRPVSLYGKLKVEAEMRIMESTNSISLRLATVFGISPRMRLDLLVNDFVWRAVKDRFIVLFESHFKRNFIHVRDVSRAFLHCIDNFDDMKNEVYNVGLSNANLSKLELCREIKKQIPDFHFIEAQIGSDPDRRNYIVSNEKIEKKGFLPKFDLQKGILELIKGYQIINNNQFSNV